MLLFGESLNVISKTIGKAFKERDPKPIQEEVLDQKAKGMDYIDINIGPCKKDGHQLMPWVCQVVQEVVPDIPLLLDTSNISAIEEGLKVLKPCQSPHIINSIMARKERYEVMLPLAAKYNADMVALLWGPDGLPRDEHERSSLAVELVFAANQAGVSNDRIWVDGIVTPVNIQQPQLISLLNFMAELDEIAPGIKSTCGLSNISNGPPTELRPLINTTYMVMLDRYGMEAVISDPLDENLTAVAKNQRPEVVDIIYHAMDDTLPDLATIDAELMRYVKTVKVIMGETLFSDSYLEE